MARVPVAVLTLAAAAASVAIPAGASDTLAQPEGTVTVESTRATSWHARGIGAGAPRQEIEVRGFARLSHRISLGGTRIRVRTLLAERSSRGELVRRPGGLDAAPLTLPRRRLHREGDRAVYDDGRSPKVRIVLNRTGAGNLSQQIAVRLQIDGGRFRQPRRCVHTTYTTLATHFIIIRGSNPVADTVITTRWSCRSLSF